MNIALVMEWSTCAKNEIVYETLKKVASQNGDYYLAFPKICCGQDRMEWDKVKELIEMQFGNTEFQIILV